MPIYTRSVFSIARCEISSGKALDVWSSPNGAFVNPSENPVTTYGETEISEALRFASRLQATEGNQGYLIQLVRGTETFEYDLVEEKPDNLPMVERGARVAAAPPPPLLEEKAPPEGASRAEAQ